MKSAESQAKETFSHLPTLHGLNEEQYLTDQFADCQSDARAELEQEVAELRKDKERLDWLENDKSVEELFDTPIPLKDYENGIWNVRGVIDTAMQKRIK